MTATALRPAPYHTDFRYTDRATKARYIALKYAPILRGSVLDVGCDAAPLRALIPESARYVGVDLCPTADVVLDLDRQDLPFPDRSFDTVVCTDVLEHLDRCHAVFDQLCRVAKDRVIVSLPNPLRNLLDAIKNGSAGRLKYYGLPLDRPPDRHRWFFGAAEAQAFIRHRAQVAGFGVEQLDFENEGSFTWSDRSGRNMLDDPNARLGTLWSVLRRD